MGSSDTIMSEYAEGISAERSDLRDLRLVLQFRTETGGALGEPDRWARDHVSSFVSFLNIGRWSTYLSVNIHICVLNRETDSNVLFVLVASTWRMIYSHIPLSTFEAWGRFNSWQTCSWGKALCTSSCLFHLPYLDTTLGQASGKS